MSQLARALIFALALVAAPRNAWSDDRSLHWRLLDVEARLDAAGDLHVVERQATVLTGAWNGVERSFRVEPWQSLRLQRLSRVGADGVLRPLAHGSVSRVDEYAWVDTQEHRLRWRSRLPADPPFAATEITYVLEYVLSGVLDTGEGGAYRLQHDFAFPDRLGPIQELHARLSIDPAWDAASAPLVLDARDLAPGRGAVMTVALRWMGQGPRPEARGPSGVAAAKRSDVRPFPTLLRVPLLAALALAFALAGAWVWRHGRSRGQFAPLPGLETVDEAWLGAHVFVHPAEVVGAAWDDKVGAPEVSAVLARMVAQRKLETHVERRHWGLSCGLHLRLRVDRRGLPPSERRLVDGLFLDGDTTDTWRLRDRYRRTGFDPARRLRGELRITARALVPIAGPLTRWPMIGVAGLAAAALLIGGLTVAGGSDLDEVALPAMAGLILLIPSGIGASRLSAAVDGLLAIAVAVVLPLALWLAGIGWLAAGWYVGGWSILCEVSAWGAAVLFVAHRCRTPLSPKGIEVRRRFATARRYFARELLHNRPALRDEWIPYLLALGLGRGMDRWLRVHGANVTSERRMELEGSSMPSWSGGGGAFSGGGASGTWAALGSISSPVPAPGGSGGSGSSGSSSGGGGGGGW